MLVSEERVAARTDARVRVVDSAAGRTVAVVSPNGYRVADISIEEAVAILRVLG
jgi:hypothetical protein